MDSLVISPLFAGQISIKRPSTAAQALQDRDPGVHNGLPSSLTKLSSNVQQTRSCPPPRSLSSSCSSSLPNLPSRRQQPQPYTPDACHSPFFTRQAVTKQNVRQHQSLPRPSPLIILPSYRTSHRSDRSYTSYRSSSTVHLSGPDSPPIATTDKI